MSKGMSKRNDRLLKEKRHDAYKEVGKLPEPTLCVECGALFSRGRWSWGKTRQKVHEGSCPACQRIADNYPAGYVEMKGRFFQEHQDEILNLARNIESQEKNERPLERIMAIEEHPEQAILSTTGIHLARRIGDALSRSYKGELTIRYLKEDQDVRICWQRS
jgi:NMD protein affecting ribosome stability and mRNA decay